MKKFYLSLVGLALAVSSILLFNVLGADSNAALPRDCDNNAIIECGAVDAAELAKDYKANVTGDLDNIYKAYGISAAEMANANAHAKMGEIHRDGRVTVNGKTVATDAYSIGRKDIFSHSSKKVIDGKTYFNTPTQYSYANGTESIRAFVFFDANGDFKAAIMTACGNPVSAKKPAYKCNSLTKTKISRSEYSFEATASASNGASIVSYNYDFGDGKKETSKSTTLEHAYANPGTYTVKMTVNIKVHGVAKTITGPGCQVQVVVETSPPTPVYTCDSLTATKINRLDYTFTGSATAEGGATIVNYTFNFGDGSDAVVTNPANVPHKYAKAGPYTATLTVMVKVDGKEVPVTGESCKVQIVVNPDECKPGIPVDDDRCKEECKPGIPVDDDRCKTCEDTPDAPECVTTPPELPHTGPMDMIGIGVALGSLIAAGSYYYASRRNLVAQLFNR